MGDKQTNEKIYTAPTTVNSTTTSITSNNSNYGEHLEILEKFDEKGAYFRINNFHINFERYVCCLITIFTFVVGTERREGVELIAFSLPHRNSYAINIRIIFARTLLHCLCRFHSSLSKWFLRWIKNVES